MNESGYQQSAFKNDVTQKVEFFRFVLIHFANNQINVWFYGAEFVLMMLFFGKKIYNNI